MAVSIIEPSDLDALIGALRERGYEVIGPTVRDRAIVFDTIAASADLPIGWTDAQGPGTYRLERRGDEALFGYQVGPQSPKRQLFPSEIRLWKIRRSAERFEVEDAPRHETRYALFGIRACEIAAIRTQDRVFLEGPFADPIYRARREQMFVVAVNCVEAGGTCFCVSMQTGPRATRGFDLALTELIDAERHLLLAEVGSERGAEVLAAVPHREAREDEQAAGAAGIEKASRQMGRTLDTRDLPRLLAENLEHPRWDDVASRCLACTNCTLVCPTCFCSSVEDTSDLTGEHAERWRRWDSCFSLDFSYIHGGHVRPSIRGRYRQWMTHKLGTWHDQFGESGCVGCGRCITWCPVGIDITEESRAIREEPMR